MNLDKKILHIVIAGSSFAFPIGRAAASRVRLLSLGLQENGFKVRILHLNCSEQPDKVKNHKAKGAYRGVDFEYTPGTTILASSFWGRRRLQVKGLSRGLWRLIRLNQQKELDCLYLYERNYIVNTIMITICRLFRIPVVLDLAEWRPAFSNCSRFEKLVFFKYILRKIDGAMPISEYISRKLNQIYKKDGRSIPILKVPILVDVDEWAMPNQQNYGNSENYVLWCGDLAAYSKAVKFLMQIMAELLTIREDVKLRLVGEVAPSLIEKFQNYQRAINLPLSLVEFTNYIKHDELKEQYAGARALLLPLENSERDLARFPTKLGEYLACRRPVIISGLGEVKYFLDNGVNAIVCEAADVKDFAQSINFLLESPQRALAIGKEGYKLAKTVFDYRNYGPRIASFIRAKAIAE